MRNTDTHFKDGKIVVFRNYTFYQKKSDVLACKQLSDT